MLTRRPMLRPIVPLLVVVCAVAAPSAPAQDAVPTRSLQAAWPGVGQVVVDEGAAEPRSIGSYAVRVYAARAGMQPTDLFMTGSVRPRDGSLERLAFEDIDGDGTAELLVVMRSAGSGGYLAADALRLRHGVLSRVVGVEGLPARADVTAELRNAAAR